MSLARNKKGIELKTIIEILLVVIATGLLIGIFNYAASQADEKTAETLCRGFNALRFGTEIAPAGVKVNIAPRACKTIDKVDIPRKDYKTYGSNQKDGAKAELRDMLAKCWWMWLEGNKPNMFEQSALALLSQNKCFVCYTFSVNKGADFQFPEFAASLSHPYYAVDSSDRCAPAGQGGYCRACDKSTDFSREVASNKCPLGQKCCIAEDRRDECKNKGGKCLDEPSGEFTEYYSKWQCKTGNCYLKKDKIASYYDYVQGTRGAGGGAGFIAYQNELEFNSGKKYGVTLISPGNSFKLETFGLTLASVVLGGGALASPFYVPIIGTYFGLVLAGGSYYTYRLAEQSGVPNINFIYISEYDNIKDKCAIESGVGEK